MRAEQAVRLTVKTVVGDYVITLPLEDAREVLTHFLPGAETIEPRTLANLLAVTWLSRAMRADEGRAETSDVPYLTYQTDTGEGVSVRSSAVLAIEARLVDVENGMDLGSIGPDLEGSLQRRPPRHRPARIAGPDQAAREPRPARH